MGCGDERKASVITMAKAILELEMPENCCVCPCRGVDGWGYAICRLIHVKSDKYCGLAHGYYDKRHPDCPLKLVEGKEGKPHGKDY